MKKLNNDKQVILFNFVANYYKVYENTFFKKTIAFTDILINNEDNFFCLFEEYVALPSGKYRSKEIRFGKEGLESYKKNLRNRPKIDRSNQNNYDPVSMSVKRNITLIEAENIIKQRKTKLSNKLILRHETYRKENYNYRELSPLCIEYYIKKGFEETQCKIMLDKKIKETRNGIEDFKIRHGEKGNERFEDYINARKETYFKKYGVTSLQFGLASKESLKFFIPLYKKIRKMGVKKNDIYWGIRGSKEFATRYEENNYFYDFTIRSLRYIIEYNGSFWHSHPDIEYKGFLPEETIISKDIHKRQAAESRGYSLRYVWDFQDKKILQRKILIEIEELLNGPEEIRTN